MSTLKLASSLGLSLIRSIAKVDPLLGRWFTIGESGSERNYAKTTLSFHQSRVSFSKRLQPFHIA
ncbi:MAG: hypothetical protein ACJAZM_001674 [Cyclobacteriaceae bacterium]|jgi:hypothetical protein